MAMSQQPTESSHLLRQQGNSLPRRWESSLSVCSQLCLPSKAAILIIFWTAIVGATYHFVLLTAAALIDAITLIPDASISVNDCLPYAILAFVTLFYVLSGFIADVYCGRLKLVVIGLCLILVFAALMCLVNIITYKGFTTQNSQNQMFHDYSSIFHETNELPLFILILASLVAFLIGLAGYQANVIQLGLDQLFEAPSQYLSLFILYALWMFKMGSVPLMVVIPLLLCTGPKLHVASGVILVSPLIIAVILILMLIVSWYMYKRHWFFSHARLENPYKTVFKIINFARKHKHPIMPSAFTYCDNYMPSRLDFAKERYGGPFTVEQVENVKTFLRILVILFSVGPVFALEVPSSYFFFPIFGFHILQYNTHGTGKYCTGQHIVVGTGTLAHILSTLILFPVYMYITFSMLHKKVQKMFQRIFIGALSCFLGVASLLVIDTIGHSLKHTNVSNHTQCMFQMYKVNGTLQDLVLNMHWSVLIPPSLFLGVGPLILMTATLEFVSAQSPQSMKGLLIGIFFAIRGLFQFLNSVMILPFSLKHPWASGEMLNHPPITNCGFVYFLFTCVVGFCGLVLFSVAAKKYKYRARNEGMFQQIDIEEIFEREIEQASMDNAPYYKPCDLAYM